MVEVQQTAAGEHALSWTSPLVTFCRTAAAKAGQVVVQWATGSRFHMHRSFDRVAKEESRTTG